MSRTAPLLLPVWRGPGLPGMGALRSSTLFGILALLAVLGMGLASGWHSATFHDDNPVHIASGDRHDASLHDASGQDDPDAPIHVAAHAFGHWMLTPVSADLLFATPLLALRHLLPIVRQLSGIRGPDLLRPPER